MSSYSMRALILIRADSHLGQWLPLSWLIDHLRNYTAAEVSAAANDLAGLGLIQRTVINGQAHYGVKVTERSEVLAS